MSWELMLATRHWEVSPIARHVGTIIAGHANRGGLAWPSLETIAAETGWSRRAVMRAVREIEDAGYFTVVARIGRVSQYVFAPGYPQIVRDHPAIGGGPTVTDPGQTVTDPGPTVTQKNREELCKEESGLSTDEEWRATIADIRSRANLQSGTGA